MSESQDYYFYPDTGTCPHCNTADSLERGTLEATDTKGRRIENATYTCEHCKESCWYDDETQEYY